MEDVSLGFALQKWRNSKPVLPGGNAENKYEYKIAKSYSEKALHLTKADSDLQPKFV